MLPTSQVQRYSLSAHPAAELLVVHVEAEAARSEAEEAVQPTSVAHSGSFIKQGSRFPW